MKHLGVFLTPTSVVFLFWHKKVMLRMALWWFYQDSKGRMFLYLNQIHSHLRVCLNRCVNEGTLLVKKKEKKKEKLYQAKID